MSNAIFDNAFELRSKRGADSSKMTMSVGSTVVDEGSVDFQPAGAAHPCYRRKKQVYRFVGNADNTADGAGAGRHDIVLLPETVAGDLSAAIRVKVDGLVPGSAPEQYEGVFSIHNSGGSYTGAAGADVVANANVSLVNITGTTAQGAMRGVRVDVSGGSLNAADAEVVVCVEVTVAGDFL